MAAGMEVMVGLVAVMAEAVKVVALAAVMAAAVRAGVKEGVMEVVGWVAVGREAAARAVARSTRADA